MDFPQRVRYFTGRYVDIDEVANVLRSEHGFPYEGSADFLSDVSENLWNKKETRYSIADALDAFDENNPDYQKQYDEIVAKYKGTPKWLKTPNGKPTKLTERQWVQVRTQAFKDWFGDWETLAIINEVKNFPAMEITPHESLDKAGIKEVFKSFGEVENARDGRKVIFPSATAGKIKYHKGFNSTTIVKDFGKLFETSIPIISEKEIKKDGHKEHRGVETYEHYVNKFRSNGFEYFIRFTTPVIKNEKGASNVHSSAISEVSIYKKEGASNVVSAYNNAESNVSISGKVGSSNFVDNKLANFLRSVNEKDVSKVVDENGEPLVVYNNPDIRYSFVDTRTDEEIEALNKKFADLYEQSENGNKKAYEEAVQLVAEEAKRKGYEVKVYHGTGSDGFNVAKADASEEQNGEGNQAHGLGIYMAVSTDTAERYMLAADKESFWTITGKRLSELGINSNDLKLVGYELYNIFQLITNQGFDSVIRGYENRIRGIKETIEYLGKDSDYEQKLSGNERQLNAVKAIKSIFDERNLTEKDIDLEESDGKVFDWVHNMKPEELLDENKTFNEQDEEVQKKIVSVFEKLFSERFSSSAAKEALGYFLNDNLKGWEIYDKLVGAFGGSKRKANEALLDGGIRGITYEGRQDGRCFVSFEGGATVKLQDPFTFDNEGKLIPLTKRFDDGNPDMRFSMADNPKYDEYREELHEVAKLNRFDMEKRNIKIGESPDVFGLIGLEERPLYMGGNVVWKSMFEDKKGRYIPEETLGKIGEAIENPIFIEKSSSKENAILVHTELENQGKRLAVAIHLSRKNNGYVIHKIASVYSRSKSQNQRVLSDGRLLYLDTERGLTGFMGQELQLPRHKSLKDLFVNGKVLTQRNLSQYKKLKKSENSRFSFADSDFEEKKRKDTIKLAREIYSQIKQEEFTGNYNDVKATPEQVEKIYMSDLSYLDEDVEEVVSNAEALAYKPPPYSKKREPFFKGSLQIFYVV